MEGDFRVGDWVSRRNGDSGRSVIVLGPNTCGEIVVQQPPGDWYIWHIDEVEASSSPREPQPGPINWQARAEALAAVVEGLREFVYDEMCDCHDEYGKARPHRCRRCVLLDEAADPADTLSAVRREAAAKAFERYADDWLKDGNRSVDVRDVAASMRERAAFIRAAVKEVERE